MCPECRRRGRAGHLCYPWQSRAGYSYETNIKWTFALCSFNLGQRLDCVCVHVCMKWSNKWSSGAPWWFLRESCHVAVNVYYVSHGLATFTFHVCFKTVKEILLNISTLHHLTIWINTIARDAANHFNSDPVLIYILHIPF